MYTATSKPTCPPLPSCRSARGNLPPPQTTTIIAVDVNWVAAELPTVQDRTTTEGYVDAAQLHGKAHLPTCVAPGARTSARSDYLLLSPELAPAAHKGTAQVRSEEHAYPQHLPLDLQLHMHASISEIDVAHTPEPIQPPESVGLEAWKELLQRTVVPPTQAQPRIETALRAHNTEQTYEITCNAIDKSMREAAALPSIATPPLKRKGPGKVNIVTQKVPEPPKTYGRQEPDKESTAGTTAADTTQHDNGSPHSLQWKPLLKATHRTGWRIAHLNLHRPDAWQALTQPARAAAQAVWSSFTPTQWQHPSLDNLWRSLSPTESPLSWARTVVAGKLANKHMHEAIEAARRAEAATKSKQLRDTLRDETGGKLLAYNCLAGRRLPPLTFAVDPSTGKATADPTEADRLAQDGWAPT